MLFTQKLHVTKEKIIVRETPCNENQNRLETEDVKNGQQVGEAKPFDNKPSHSTCCHLTIGAGTKLIHIH